MDCKKLLMNHSVVLNQLMGRNVENVLHVCIKGRLLEMLGLIVRIKNFVKECIETFNEVEKFRVEHNLPNSVDCNFYGFSEIK